MMSFVMLFLLHAINLGIIQWQGSSLPHANLPIALTSPSLLSNVPNHLAGYCALKWITQNFNFEDIAHDLMTAQSELNLTNRRLRFLGNSSFFTSNTNMESFEDGSNSCCKSPPEKLHALCISLFLHNSSMTSWLGVFFLTLFSHHWY